MSTYLIPSREDDTTMGPVDSPGRRLRIARQSRGLTQERVAQELHLHPTMIEALEHEDYKSLPEPVFVAGYVRKYARLVGLAPEPLVAAYGAAPARVRTDTAVRAGHRRTGVSHLTVGLVGLGILLLVGVLTFLWRQYQRPDLGLETTAAAEVGREAAVSDMLDKIPEPELSAFLTDLEDLLADQETGQSPEPGSDPETAQPQPPTTDGTTAAVGTQPTGVAQDTAATIAGKSGAIEVSFNGPCWADVRDSEQKHKLFGKMEKGDHYVLEGKPPHAFILGNAAAVQVTVRGKPLDLSTVSRGNVARFTLDADGRIR
ncbi:RodZ domain-containing protein [Candidatus Thiosymbion oneisti]|uniref:RodZ domain-containing protein n=1 Tax=Candidatus Thiosymbion oneisti TaxID=589554 RepID=UPI000B7C7409|nr:RodZ domain-containing protein [Candidatus Thiosymbion oneisti]